MAQEIISVPSKKSVRRAGEILRADNPNSEELKEAMDTLSEWRACYYQPINTIKTLVNDKIKTLKIKKSIVAQRLKRTPSIVGKLKRIEKMQLDRMQDIGGVRAVVNNIEEVRKLHDAITNGHHRHEVIVPPKDYIERPKPDGYRGIHQVFKYHASQHPELNGLLVEVQIRTALQHYWATAVETLGAIEKSAFKSGEGDERVKHFFKLSSALFSIEEKQPVLESLSKKTPIEIVDEFEILESELGVFDRLSAFTQAVQTLDGVKNGKTTEYYLLIMNSVSKSVSFVPFTEQQLELATWMYKIAENDERENKNIDVVLVASKNMKELKTAYPNYFVDTNSFIEKLKQICQSIRKAHALIT